MKTSSVSANIIAARKAKGLTQDKLAEQAGLTKRMVVHCESESGDIPLSNLMKISKALGVSISALVGETGHKEQNFGDLDIRTLRKIKKLKELPPAEQRGIWHYITLVIERFEAHQLKSAKKEKAA